MIHPEICEVSSPKSGENYHSEGAWVGGSMDLRDGAATMSLDGTSGGVMLRGLDEVGLRTVIYVNIFPNVLISLHPDYVMTHRLTPLAVDSTQIECTWAFAPEAVARPDFDPSYAIEPVGHHQPDRTGTPAPRCSGAFRRPTPGRGRWPARRTPSTST